MKDKKETRITMSIAVTREVRRLVELLAAQFTLSKGRRYTLTEIVEIAIESMASKNGVKNEST